MRALNKFKTILISFLFSALLVNTAIAGIENEMGNMFGSMVNTTPATANVNGVQRGVIAGPGIAVKNRISNINVVSFVPPSFEAGCGGIDFFGGSFSFISAEQFQQLLRNIAANAVGYAFKLALGSMCPECAQELADLQDTIQKWNQMLGDSCQAAQLLVDNTIGSQLQSMNTELGTKLSSLGLGSAFDFFTGSDNQNAVTTGAASDNFKPCTYSSNFLWCAMRRGAIQSWFVSNDIETLEVAMSLAGSIVIGEVVPAEDGQGDSPEVKPIKGATLSVKDFVEGGEVTRYVCDTDDKCLNPTEQVANITGMKQRILNVLLGPAGSGGGAIAKMADNSGALTTEELNVMANLPYGLGPMIRNLAVKSQSIAELFAQEAAPHIAYGMVEILIKDLLDAAERATASTDSQVIESWKPIVRDAKAELYEQARSLQAGIGPVTNLVEHYVLLMEAVKDYRSYGREVVGSGINSNTVRDR